MTTMRTTALAAALFLAFAATPAVAGNLDSLFAGYEELRAALAKDDASEVGPLAKTIGAAARREMKETNGAAAARLASIRDAAAQLEKAHGNLAASRAAFASLSKAVIDVLAASPEMAKDKFVYACPMVKGYGKWVQQKKSIENPYYGAAMLRCAVPAAPES